MTQSFQLSVPLGLASAHVISAGGTLGTREDSGVSALVPLGLARTQVISAFCTLGTQHSKMTAIRESRADSQLLVLVL